MRSTSGDCRPSGACSRSAAPGADDATDAVPSGKKGLGYDAKKGLYTYSWATDKAWKNTCRTFVLKLADGTTHTAEFQFTK